MSNYLQSQDYIENISTGDYAVIPSYRAKKKVMEWLGELEADMIKLELENITLHHKNEALREENNDIRCDLAQYYG